MERTIGKTELLPSPQPLPFHINLVRVERGLVIDLVFACSLHFSSHYQRISSSHFVLNIPTSWQLAEQRKEKNYSNLANFNHSFYIRYDAMFIGNLRKS